MVGLILSTARKLALKIASYGVMHLVVAVLVAFAITRDWRIALAVGLLADLNYRLPDQDLEIDFRRLPALPRSGFRMMTRRTSPRKGGA